MRKVIVGIALATMLSTGVGWAQETDPASDISAQWQAEQAARVQRQARLDVLMTTMAEEMQTIRSTSDQTERARLMAAHRKHMRESMQLMREMGGMHMRDVVAEHLGRGTESAASSDSSQHQHKRMPAVRPRAQMSDAERLADLETRLDMMQIMMESIMEAQAR